VSYIIFLHSHCQNWDTYHSRTPTFVSLVIEVCVFSQFATVYLSSLPSVKFGHARKVLRGRNKWKSLGTRSGLYSIWLNSSHWNCLCSWIVCTAVWSHTLSCSNMQPEDSRPRHLFWLALLNFFNVSHYTSNVTGALGFMLPPAEHLFCPKKQ
jgi:hypothetical protein